MLHNVPNCHDRESWAAFGDSLAIAYPDSQTTYNLLVVEVDLAAALWTYRGTHTRPLGDYQPTGQKLDVDGMMFTRVHDGRIVEHWSWIDKLAWLQQLGTIDQSVALR